MGSQTSTSIVDRLPRAEYGEMVRLVAPGGAQPIVAQARNISPSGMLVDVAQPWAVGTEVQCDVPLPGGARTFRGRVARMHAQRDSGGMGIQFLDLSDTATTLLQEVVQARNGQPRPVDVWFEGRRKPSRLEATVTDRGIRLTSPLPLFRLGSTIRFGFAGEQKTSIAAGVLAGIGVARGKRGEPACLELDITFVRPDAAAGELAAGGGATRMKTELLPYRPTTSERLRRRRLLLSVGAIVLGVGVLAVALRLTASWMFGSAHPAVAAAPAGDRTTAAPVATTVPMATASSAVTVSALPSRNPTSTVNAAKLARMAWQKNAPQLHVDGDSGAVVIPISGTVQGATTQTEDPHVLVISIPRARPLVTAARYSFQQAGVSSVTIAHKGAGSLVTLQLADPPPSIEQVRIKPTFIQVGVRAQH